MSRAGIIEIVLDGAAAAWVGGASAYAFALAAPLSGPALWFVASALATVVAIGAYLGFVALRDRRFRLPAFDGESLKTVPVLRDELLLTADMTLLKTELLLTEQYRLTAAPSAKAVEELLLDDVLTAAAPNSRVVQLFDPSRMPTAGELKSRIDRHLRNGGRPAAPEPQPDASQALFDALADLRRSLA